MVKKTVTFPDFEGKEVTKDFYFNLSKMEFRVLDRKIPGGLQNMIDQIMKEKDEDRLIDLLDILILESYGEKSEDGRFVKEDRYGRRLSSFFKISEAWDVLFMNLVSNENELHEFLMGIVPKDVAEKAEAESAKTEGTLTPATTNVTPMPSK
jgi:hypothetical protein